MTRHGLSERERIRRLEAAVETSVLANSTLNSPELAIRILAPRILDCATCMIGAERAHLGDLPPDDDIAVLCARVEEAQISP